MVGIAPGHVTQDSIANFQVSKNPAPETEPQIQRAMENLTISERYSKRAAMFKELHNTTFPGHVCGNFYEYRGVGIFKDGARYRVDFATGNKWVSSLEYAKREIDFALMNQPTRRVPGTKK